MSNNLKGLEGLEPFRRIIFRIVDNLIEKQKLKRKTKLLEMNQTHNEAISSSPQKYPTNMRKEGYHDYL